MRKRGHAWEGGERKLYSHARGQKNVVLTRARAHENKDIRQESVIISVLRCGECHFRQGVENELKMH